MAKGKPLKQIEIKEDAYKLTHEIEDNKNEIMTIDNNINEIMNCGMTIGEWFKYMHENGAKLINLFNANGDKIATVDINSPYVEVHNYEED